MWRYGCKLKPKHRDRPSTLNELYVDKGDSKDQEFKLSRDEKSQPAGWHRSAFGTRPTAGWYL